MYWSSQLVWIYLILYSLFVLAGSFLYKFSEYKADLSWQNIGILTSVQLFQIICEKSFYLIIINE